LSGSVSAATHFPSSARSRPVGATRPVELDTNGKALLVEALGSWIDRADEGKLPTGLTELRAALVTDLDAAGYWNR
jgi:hypothetical protein